MMARPIRLDLVDLEICRELLVGDASHLESRRMAIEAVAKRLGIHRNTVVRRLVGMRLKRFIFPLTLMVDMERVGWHAGRALFDVPTHRRTRAMLDAALTKPGVLMCFEYAEGWEFAFLAPDPLSVRSHGERLGAALGARKVEWLIETAIDWPQRTPVALDETDRRLMLALIPDARASFGRLARTLGMEKRTLERRYRRLQAEKVVRMFPAGGSAVTNLSIVNVQFSLEPDADRAHVLRQVVAAFPQHIARDFECKRPWLWAFAARPEDNHLAAKTALGIAGVFSVRLLHSQGLVMSPHYSRWLAGAIRQSPLP